MIQSLLSFLQSNPQYLLFSIFFISLLESLAVIGIIVPGVGLLVGLSILAGNLNINIAGLLSVGIAGAILGDSISFYFGQYFQNKLPNLWPFNRNPSWLTQGHLFFKKHGAVSIFLGRFIGPIRPFIPLVAGMMKMPQSTFIRWNILSALCWAPAYLLPGYWLGDQIEASWFTSWKGLAVLGVMTLIAIFISLIFKNKKA